MVSIYADFSYSSIPLVSTEDKRYTVPLLSTEDNVFIDYFIA